MNPPTDQFMRLITLLPWLVANPDCTLSEIAQRFEVSEKEALSDVMLLTVTGPDQFGGGLVDIAYDEKFVTVRDAKGLDRPTTIRKIEAVSLLIGLKTLRQVATATLVEEIDALMKKILDEADLSSNIAASIEFDELEPELMALCGLIDETLTNEALLQFQYTPGDTAKKPSQRLIRPTTMTFDQGHVYLTGYDNDRQAERMFRLDRMTQARMIEPGLRGADQELDFRDLASNNDETQESKTQEEFCVTIFGEAAHVIDEFLPIQSGMDANGDISAKFALYSKDWAVQTTLSLVPWIIEVQPRWLKDAIMAALTENIANHQT